MCTEDIVAVAKRENNAKRAYLVVNRLQGKHIPVDPAEAFGMFHALAQKIGDSYKGQSLLLVGFAETATAIGAAVAAELDAFYIQTTREELPGVEYLYFSESHSHATEQRLVKDDLGQIMEKVSRIVFIEDEVTTGNTILNIIRLLRENYGNYIKFSVASILNGMSLESQEIYKRQEIDALYLLKTDHSGYGEIAEGFAGNGVYHKKDLSNIPAAIPQIDEVALGMEKGMASEVDNGRRGGEGTGRTEGKEAAGMEEAEMAGAGRVRVIGVLGARNARRLVTGAAYQGSCQRLWEEVQAHVPLRQGQSILVLGTEEFMYPPLFVAEKLQESGYQVKCHATTRSPIAVSMEEDYPLHERYELVSFYDEGRVTYIYDLAQYDLVLILTDAPSKESERDWGEDLNMPFQKNAGLASLQNALHSCGSQNIFCVRWFEK